MPLSLNAETSSRMQASIAARGGFQQQTPEQVEARQRMAMFPTGEQAEVLFVQEDKWVPVVRVMGKVSCRRKGYRPLLTRRWSLVVHLPRYAIPVVQLYHLLTTSRLQESPPCSNSS